jgi:hypothetical protein
MPTYIRNEYRSLLGRAGRGRLWVSEELSLPDDFNISWPDTTLAARLADDYGGIVIREEDLRMLAALPGITTDLELWRVR